MSTEIWAAARREVAPGREARRVVARDPAVRWVVAAEDLAARWVVAFPVVGRQGGALVALP